MIHSGLRQQQQQSFYVCHPVCNSIVRMQEILCRLKTELSLSCPKYGLNIFKFVKTPEMNFQLDGVQCLLIQFLYFSSHVHVNWRSLA